MKYTKEKLKPIIDSSFSVREVILKLGLKDAGGNYNSIKNIINKYEFDTTHFRGQLWSKGNTSLNDKRIKSKYSSIDEIFKTNSTVGNERIKRILISENLIKNKCGGKNCNVIDNWNGKKIILELDHINGVNNDNRIKNLRLLCPNCHSQTPTFRRKKK
jgi:hypothetical protein